MTTYKTLALVFLVGGLTACNESDSNDISTDRLVLDGILYVENNAAKMEVSFSKEKSYVTIVLNGGDFLQATDGKSINTMEYQSNIILGSFYRTTLPLDINNTYKIIFNRAAQNQKFENTFPAIPPAFSIVFPTDKQTFSVAANPTINVQWDTKVNSEKLFLRGGYGCSWTANPAVFDTQSQKMKTELTNGQEIDITLTDKERDLRTRTLHIQQSIDDMAKGLKSTYPDTNLSFNNCDVDIAFIAKNFSSAHPEFSGKSGLQSYRKIPIKIALTP